MDRPFEPDRNVYGTLLDFIKRRRPTALATVIETSGSTPQVAGASALFSEDGLAAGTVGGGFVEAEVERRARRAIRTRSSGVISFVLDEDSFEDADGLCGGTMRILVDGWPEKNEQAFRELITAVRRRRAGVLATRLVSRRGISMEINRTWWPKVRGDLRSRSGFLNIEAGEQKRIFALEQPEHTRKKGRRLYLEPHHPSPRLVIAGAGHVGRAVAHQGRLLGFEVVVIDDRPEYADPARIPDADRVICGGIADRLRSYPTGGDTYIVIVTRGHRHDEAALRACLRRRAAYIGMIGSRRKIDLMQLRFLERRWATPAVWARVRAPIGLPIGSRTVNEIAVSIAAELVSTRRHGQISR
jgi:xanthine dehydrogenase accessory factor